MPENIDHKITLFSLLAGKIKAAADEGKGFEKAMGNIENVSKKVEEATGIAFNVEKVVEFGKKIAEVTVEYDGLFNRVKAYSANASDAAANTAFIKREVTELHLPMKQVVERFTDLETGLKSTGIEGQRLRNLFHGISAAAVSMRMPDEQVKSTLDNLKEIGESGLTETTVKGLKGALPQIDALVQQTFGKTIYDLEGHISGGEFLQKIGPALETQFQSGLQGWGSSLEAKMNDTQNNMTTTMLDMGEKLKPAFMEIMDTMQTALNSAPVQYLVTNIAGLIKIVGIAAQDWLIYKGVLTTVELATSAYKFALEAAEVAQYTATFGLEGLTIASEGFSAALTTTGIGAFAVALGFIIDKIVEANKEFDESIDKITRLKDFQKREKDVKDNYTQDFLNYKELTKGKLTTNEANDAYNNLVQHSSEVHKKLIDTEQQIEDVNAKLAKTPSTRTSTFVDMGGARTVITETPEYAELMKQKKELQKQADNDKWTLDSYAGGKQYYESKGIKGTFAYTQPKLEGKDATGGKDNGKTTEVRGEGQKVQTFNITIGDLIKDFTIATTNLSEAPAKVREIIVQALLSAVSDSQISIAH